MKERTNDLFNNVVENDQERDAKNQFCKRSGLVCFCLCASAEFY